MRDDSITIERLDPPTLEMHVAALAELLRVCVHAGASVNFVLPFTQDDALAFWENKVVPVVKASRRAVVIARAGDAIIGTVQLDWDTPPNQPHRAEIAKLLVHPDFRSRGIARALMVEMEDHAKALGKTLLTLDTAHDHAEALYSSLGYKTVGVIPGYAVDPLGSDRLDATVLMYKVV